MDRTANIKEEIHLHGKSLGLTEIGFCNHLGKTAVCVLFPYYYEDKEKSNLSIYARSLDYHKVAKKLLEKLLLPFTENFELYVDIGEADNIEVAKKAGLGIIGKNKLLINENLGSYFFIGYALTNLEIEADTPLESTCLSCNKCINACPGKALSENGFNVENCASNISQKKGELSQSEISILKKSGLIFGCDICQDVCPMNKKKITCLHEFSENRICFLKKSDIEGLSNKEFMKLHSDRAFAWRGKGVLLRNMDIIK